MDGSILKHDLAVDFTIKTSVLFYKGTLKLPDPYSIVDMTTDFMGRVLFVNNNSNLRIIEGKFVETLRKDVTGGFGKCLKLNKHRDRLLVIQDSFAITSIDLTSSTFQSDQMIEVKEQMDSLSDWAIDEKGSIVYFLIKEGSILICDLKNKTQTPFKIDEKWFIYLVKEDRHFNSMAINYNKKLLAVSGVTMYKDKKTNNILLYRIDYEKDSIRLTQITQAASLNMWDGSRVY